MKDWRNDLSDVVCSILAHISQELPQEARRTHEYGLRKRSFQLLTFVGNAIVVGTSILTDDADVFCSSSK